MKLFPFGLEKCHYKPCRTITNHTQMLTPQESRATDSLLEARRPCLGYRYNFYYTSSPQKMLLSSKAKLNPTPATATQDEQHGS